MEYKPFEPGGVSIPAVIDKEYNSTEVETGIQIGKSINVINNDEVMESDFSEESDSEFLDTTVLPSNVENNSRSDNNTSINQVNLNNMNGDDNKVMLRKNNKRSKNKASLKTVNIPEELIKKLIKLDSKKDKVTTLNENMEDNPGCSSTGKSKSWIEMMDEESNMTNEDNSRNNKINEEINYYEPYDEGPYTVFAESTNESIGRFHNLALVCHGNHQANDKECKFFKVNKEIKEMMALHNISYLEAKNMMWKKGYAEAAKINPYNPGFNSSFPRLNGNTEMDSHRHKNKYELLNSLDEPEINIDKDRLMLMNKPRNIMYKRRTEYLRPINRYNRDQINEKPEKRNQEQLSLNSIDNRDKDEILNKISAVNSNES
ncbi:asparagine-rich protein-like [Ctenocephalides felis]|uniref:asparagine-rich protein-like n=1 Tax=Ctenocephalides felis TaxID=7515 RepID=UPI000E6E2395|nr:asparagine-rich protein-like [Ctenocephalides felis]